MAYRIDEIPPDLFLISLSPPIRGFDDFLSSWLYRGKRTFLIDVGSSATSGELIAALDRLRIKTLDAILLTHIHIDHAGAVGEISDHFPETPILCHPKGIPHLVDPAPLWDATVKTLGDIGRAYGPMKSVPSNRLVSSEDCSVTGVTPIPTPGHAPHHIGYSVDRYLFAGEAGGVCLNHSKEAFYLRPATPPRFFLNVNLASVDALIEYKPELLCFGHGGMHPGGIELLGLHRGQLPLWADIIAQVLEGEDASDPVERALRRLLSEDPLLSGFNRLSDAVQERERYFLKNSIKGFVGYLSRPEHRPPSP